MLTFRWRMIELVLEERCAEISLEAAMGCWRWKVSCGSKLETSGLGAMTSVRAYRATNFPEPNKQDTVAKVMHRSVIQEWDSSGPLPEKLTTVTSLAPIIYYSI